MSQAIKQELEAIIQDIEENKIRPWQGDNNDTLDAVALEEFDPYDEDTPDEDRDEPNTKYNGWYERLLALRDSL
jgi:hypothetical protein